METVYETNATELQSSTVVSLDKPRNATDVYIIHSTGRTLSLCDVRIFGDCLDGYYGWLCEDVCTCKDPAEVCDKVLGSCPQTGCRTGRRGLGCQERCAPGYYGDGCETKCDECIDEDCDPVNGTCMRGCLAGWTGDRCDEACPTGTYGNNCKNTCSVHCEDQDCFPGNGTCTKPCPPGQTGSFCDKVCANGTYGYSCASICSDVCVESICHPVNGTCSRGCKTGLVGDDCSQEYTSVTFGPERRDKGSTNCASGEPPPNLSGIFATCFSIGFVISLAVYVTIKRCRCCVRNLSSIVYRV
ncbi:protein draper-like isoform X2 [Pomacea canaliculata]|nr:protein draper-like isoform X2 [Pomacea canaliculata]XP_025079523.1 protein draper-like isoform X2 [Pomacea canaliculata]